jgi:hypothetical protein
MLKYLIASLLIASSAAAAEPKKDADPKPQVEHTIRLTDADLQFMSSFLGLYAGKGCNVTDEGAQLCHAVDPARALAKKIDAQLQAEKEVAVNPAK